MNKAVSILAIMLVLVAVTQITSGGIVNKLEKINKNLLVNEEWGVELECLTEYPWCVKPGSVWELEFRITNTGEHDDEYEIYDFEGNGFPTYAISDLKKVSLAPGESRTFTVTAGVKEDAPYEYSIGMCITAQSLIGPPIDAAEVEIGFEIKPSNGPYKVRLWGPTTCEAGETCTYTMTAEDPEGDEIYYEIIWGESIVDCNTTIIGPFPSGAEATIDITWEEEGKMFVNVQAFNHAEVHGKSYLLFSHSKELPVVVPYSYSKNTGLLQNLISKIYPGFFKHKATQYTTIPHLFFLLTILKQ